MSVTDRINSQISIPRQENPEFEGPIVAPEPAIPIEPDELKKIFVQELLSEPVEALIADNTMSFDGIESFVSWYFNVRDLFSEGQKVALSTLVQCRDMIFHGCKCKEKERRVQANEYYKIFWENNKTTDLPLKILEIGQFSKISFLIDTIEFVSFSPSTP